MMPDTNPASTPDSFQDSPRDQCPHRFVRGVVTPDANFSFCDPHVVCAECGVRMDRIKLLVYHA